VQVGVLRSVLLWWLDDQVMVMEPGNNDVCMDAAHCLLLHSLGPIAGGGVGFCVFWRGAGVVAYIRGCTMAQARLAGLDTAGQARAMAAFNPLMLACNISHLMLLLRVWQAVAPCCWSAAECVLAALLLCCVSAHLHVDCTRKLPVQRAGRDRENGS
jgi:hypothetical protein